METSARMVTTPVEIRTDFVHWTPVIAGALVAAALSLLLIAFGASLGLGVSSTAPTLRSALIWTVPDPDRSMPSRFTVLNPVSENVSV